MTQPPAGPLDDRTRDRLRSVSTATLATQLFKRGYQQQFLVGVNLLGDTCDRWVGLARTMRFIPSRPDLETLTSLPGKQNLQWLAIETLGAGEVLLIDSGSNITAASSGAMLLTRAMLRGAAAVITDGAFRDGTDIAALAMPAYARANTASTRLTSFHVADLDVPIGCAGVAVFPGDVVVGDCDGVIVIPRALAEEIAVDADEQERLEEYLHTRVLTGEELWGLYPPNEQTLKQYDEWRSHV